MKSTLSCPLCASDSRLYHQIETRSYFECTNCAAIFMDPQHYLSPEEEKARYETHNNDVDDTGYQQFVLPMVDEVKKNYAAGSSGLDYGAGTGPVAAKLLREAEYNITTYDPFFEPNAAAFQQNYDFIIAGEVIEHFHHPAKEFRLLKALLNPGGHLYCMTLRYTNDINFEEWYYKNDPTHVIFYQAETAEWIKGAFGFSSLVLKKRVIVLQG